MELGIAGRGALVTGAAGGIGRAVAEALAAEGARVALVDRVAPEEHAARMRAGGADAVAIGADVTDELQVSSAVAAAVAAFGGLHIVVGCAGISGPVGTALTDTTLADWRAVFDVNVTGSFLLLKHALPVLAATVQANAVQANTLQANTVQFSTLQANTLQADAVQSSTLQAETEQASAVLVASDSALVVAPGMAAYCASKAAVLQLVKAASVENERVRVNAICPSIVDTPMSRGDLGLTAGFAGVDYPVQTAAEVAAEIVFLCSPWARAVDGAALVSDFGYTARSNFPA
jgi:NAD(P)-dependent dehydrogenase (short-subunit alcohol dehydrogenase family)